MISPYFAIHCMASWGMLVLHGYVIIFQGFYVEGHKENLGIISASQKWRANFYHKEKVLLTQLFYFFCLPHLHPLLLLLLPHLPWTVLGWRLKSLEWAHSNIYPSPPSEHHMTLEQMALHLVYVFLCVLMFLILKWLNLFLFSCVYCKHVYLHCH